MRKVSLIVAACALLTTGLLAAEVWETKPFLQWSDKELQKVMTDSPWAGKGSLTHARQGANLGSVPDWKLTVSIRSALPMKQALVREDVGMGGVPVADHEALLASKDELYVVSLSGIPAQFAAQLQRVADVAVLKRRNKADIMATQGTAIRVGKDGKPVADATPRDGSQPQIVRVAQRGGGGAAPRDDSGITMTLLLGFPKTDPIIEQDREFEFATVIGTYNVKRTFKLKDMMFQGDLAL